MSVVVVGGNDRMAGRYKDICEGAGCRAKVFTQMPSDFAGKIGRPDLILVFTGTCSHKMLGTVKTSSSKHGIPVEHIRCGSVNALKTVLAKYC